MIANHHRWPWIPELAGTANDRSSELTRCYFNLDNSLDILTSESQSTIYHRRSFCCNHRWVAYPFYKGDLVY